MLAVNDGDGSNTHTGAALGFLGDRGVTQIVLDERQALRIQPTLQRQTIRAAWRGVDFNADRSRHDNPRGRTGKKGGPARQNGGPQAVPLGWGKHGSADCCAGLLDGRLEALQAHRVAEDEDAGQCHRASRQHRRQQCAAERIKHARRDRDQSRVVGEGPEQVLLDVADRCLRQSDRVGDTEQISRHQHHIGAFDRDIRAGADRHADISLGQGRRIVDAIADEGYGAAADP